MCNQLDLFATANCDFEEEQRVKEKQKNLTIQLEQAKKDREEFLTKNLTTRQHRLVDYLENNFQKGRYFTIEELCAANLGYELNTNPRTHDKCIALGNDIRQINWAIGSRYSIIVKDKKGSAKLCESKEEFDEWKQTEKDKLERKYQYLNNLQYKANLDNTIPLVNLNDRALSVEEMQPVNVFKGRDL